MDKDNLFKHSSVIFISVVIANIFAYIFHIYMARELGPASYGELGSLLAIFMILSVPVGVIQTVITKYIARFHSGNEEGKVGSLIFSAIKKLFYYGLFTFILISVLSPFIADFLHIDSSIPVIIVGFTVLFSVILPVNRGALQGLQKFNALAINNVLEAVFRLLLGILLVVIGFGVSGALLAFGLGYFLAFLIAFISLQRYFDKRDNKIDVKEIYRFTLPVFLTVLFINLLVNLPTVFIKHYYSAEFTGLWNVALTLARAILFVSSSISLVMFSKISSLENLKEKKKIFRKSFGYVLFSSLFISLIFFFFSELILLVLFGQEYLNGAVILKWLGFGVGVIAILHLIINYLLSR